MSEQNPNETFEEDISITIDQNIDNAVDDEFYSAESNQDDEINDEDTITYNKPIEINDTFICVFQDVDNPTDMIDIIGTIQEKLTETSFVFEDENKNKYTFTIDESFTIELSTETERFSVIYIEKIQELNEELLESLDEFVSTYEMFPELDIEMEETKQKTYSIQERKEDLVNELIYDLQAQDNQRVINQISEIADNCVDMIQTQLTAVEDYSNNLPFIKQLIYNNRLQLPPWIIPVVDNVKKLYKDEEDIDEQEDIINLSFMEELQKTIMLFDSEASGINTYKELMSSLYKQTPFINKSTFETYKYDGVYLRNCTSVKPCNGLLGLYDIEIVKTKSELKIPYTSKHETLFEIITPQESIPIIGFYTLSDQFSYHTISSKLPLSDLYYLTYVTTPRFSLKEELRKRTIIPHMIGEDTSSLVEDVWTNDVHSYMFSSVIDKGNMGTYLSKNLPSFKEIIESIPDSIKEHIYNYNDFKQLFLSFDFNIHDLDSETRSMIHKLMKENIQRFISNNPQHKLSKPSKLPRSKVMDEEQLRKQTWDFISSLLIIPYKHKLLQKYISKFLRDAIETNGEDKNYLYEKQTDKKSLCTHYISECKGSDHFDTFISFGGEPVDGNIYCSVCGEYLAPENFSTFQGFDKSNNVMNSYSEIVTNESTEEYTQDQLIIKSYVESLSSMIGIQLNQIDKHQIIMLYGVLNDDSFVDHRYQMNQVMKNHPTLLQIQKDDSLTPKMKRKKIVKFKEYISDCNILLLISYLILFYIQTSKSSYQIKSKNINLWKPFNETTTWDSIKYSPQKYISVSTIDSLLQKINRMTSAKSSDPFWNHISDFQNEYLSSDKLPTFKNQFLNLSSHIFENAKIKQQMKSYIQNYSEKVVFVKESWGSYKPSLQNERVQSINETIQTQLDSNLLNSHLVREKNNYAFTNLHSLRPIFDASINPDYVLLNIPYSEILNNESFQRLLNYSLHLHGTTKQTVSTINLTLQRLLDTLQEKEFIESKLQSIGWNSSTKTLDSVNYSSLRQVFTEIIEDFKIKNPEDKQTLDVYVHIQINHWQARLLNGSPKRTYPFTSPIVFPPLSFETLQEENPEMIDKLFSKYCSEDKESIDEIGDYETFINNLTITSREGIKYEPVCKNFITKTKDSFEDILLYKRSQHKIPYTDKPQLTRETFINNRLRNFILRNNFLSFTGDITYPIFQGLVNVTRDNIDEEYDRLFNMILGYSTETISFIQNFFIESKNEEMIDTKQIRRYSSLLGKGFNSIEKIFTIVLNQSKNINQYIHSLFLLIGRLSSKRDKEGTILHSNIPKNWKVSESVISSMKVFLEENEFLLHDNIYLPYTEKQYQGFNRYTQEDSYATYFDSLYQYLQQYKIIDLHLLQGNDNDSFTVEYSQLFKQFIFLLIYRKIIEFIIELQDTSSTISTSANMLFMSLEENDRLSDKKTIELLTQASFDILMNFLEEFNDPLWIQQTSQISELIGKQKEREKQSIVEKLGSKTDDSRLASVQLQKAGIESWHHDSSKENLEHLTSESRQTQMFQERQQSFLETFYYEQGDTPPEELLNVRPLQEDLINERDELDEEGYDQDDLDREDEGLDDNDDTGDYHDN